MDSRLELCTLNWCCLTCDIYSVGNCYPQVLFLKLNYELMICCWLTLGVFIFAWVIALWYIHTPAFAGFDAGVDAGVEADFEAEFLSVRLGLCSRQVFLK